jgi:hypothetical protein
MATIEDNEEFKIPAMIEPDLLQLIPKTEYIPKKRAEFPLIVWELPFKVESESNLNENMHVKRKRKNIQYKYIWAAFVNETAISKNKTILPYPCTVKLIRMGKRNLDDDNLISGFKYIRDEVASLIKPGLARGRADDDPKIRWEYDQVKSKMNACRIEFYL